MAADHKVSKIKRKKKDDDRVFDARQEARYEAMRQSKYSSILYKQHEELQRRFERQASLIEKTKDALSTDIRRIRMRRREILNKFTDVKRNLDYFQQTSSIAESRIATLRKRHADFKQSQRVAQFLNQYGEGNGVYLYGNFYPKGRLAFPAELNHEDKSRNIGSGSVSSVGDDPYSADDRKFEARLSTFSRSSCNGSLPSTVRTSEVLRLEMKRGLERYGVRNHRRRDDVVYLFSIQNVTGRPVHIKRFPAKNPFG